jgi:hypothetical protein
MPFSMHAACQGLHNPAIGPAGVAESRPPATENFNVHVVVELQ